MPRRGYLKQENNKPEEYDLVSGIQLSMTTVRRKLSDGFQRRGYLKQENNKPEEYDLVSGIQLSMTTVRRKLSDGFQRRGYLKQENNKPEEYDLVSGIQLSMTTVRRKLSDGFQRSEEHLPASSTSSVPVLNSTPWVLLCGTTSGYIPPTELVSTSGVLVRRVTSGHLFPRRTVRSGTVVLPYSFARELQLTGSCRRFSLARPGTQLMKAFGVRTGRFELYVLHTLVWQHCRELTPHKKYTKREIPEKTCRPAASFGTIPTCENSGMTLSGIESGSLAWVAITSAQPRRGMETAFFTSPLRTRRLMGTRLCVYLPRSLTAESVRTHRVHDITQLLATWRPRGRGADLRPGLVTCLSAGHPHSRPVKHKAQPYRTWPWPHQRNRHAVLSLCTCERKDKFDCQLAVSGGGHAFRHGRARAVGLSVPFQPMHWSSTNKAMLHTVLVFTIKSVPHTETVPPKFSQDSTRAKCGRDLRAPSCTIALYSYTRTNTCPPSVIPHCITLDPIAIAQTFLYMPRCTVGHDYQTRIFVLILSIRRLLRQWKRRGCDASQVRFQAFSRPPGGGTAMTSHLRRLLQPQYAKAVITRYLLPYQTWYEIWPCKAGNAMTGAILAVPAVQTVVLQDGCAPTLSKTKSVPELPVFTELQASINIELLRTDEGKRVARAISSGDAVAQWLENSQVGPEWL
ncbi:hypothetical protein PR048_018709, partial [Dryococelus australis]